MAKQWVFFDIGWMNSYRGPGRHGQIIVDGGKRKEAIARLLGFMFPDE